jgi:IclR family transcriptional regulator, KDG regulon repressor
MRTSGSLSVPTQAIARVGQLLDLFSPTRVELGLSELARGLDVNKATAHRLAQSLLIVGLLDQDPETRAYRLGTRFLELGTLVAGSLDIRKRALPVLRDLCDRLGETTYLMVLRGHAAICIERIEGTHPLRDAVTQIGSVLPLHVGGAGIALLAHLPKETVNEVLAEPLEQRTPFTVVEPNAIKRRLHEVRKSGYAVSLNDLVVGTGAVAAPIFTSSGDTVAALSVGSVAPTVEQRQHELADAVVEASERISSQLGFTRPAGGTRGRFDGPASVDQVPAIANPYQEGQVQHGEPYSP